MGSPSARRIPSRYADEAHSDATWSPARTSRAGNGSVGRTAAGIVRSKTVILRERVKRRSAICLDLGLDLLVLPLSYVALTSLRSQIFAPPAIAEVSSSIFLWIAAGCSAFSHLRSARLGAQRRGVQDLDLARVPWFLTWKLSAACAPRLQRMDSHQRESN